MSERLCPKCSKPMSLWSPGELELDHCPVCKGLWFDANELSRHLATLGAPRLDEAPTDGAPLSLRCPSCAEQKLVGSFLFDVSVESCPACHGVFLDLGELHELLGVLCRPERASNPDSSLSGMDSFALGLFVGMRRKR